MAKPKELKEDVFYTVVPDPEGKTCGDTRRCKAFEEVPGANGDGVCRWVNGIILRTAKCDLHEEVKSNG